jgi:hypothetical protein
MEETSALEKKERERAARLAEATGILQAAEAQARAVAPEEDARVLELMECVRTLDEQIGHLKRHHETANLKKGAASR